MEKIFSGDVYQTPANTARWWLDRLAGNGRIVFHGRYIATLLKARWQLAQGRYDTKAWWQTSLALLNLIETSGGRLHVTGIDNIRVAQSPVVFASKHMSSLENNVLPSFIVPIQPVTYVIKASLTKYPVLGPLVKARRTIAVGRTNPREDLQTVMREGTQLLNEGISVILFPEGTRRTWFDPAEFNSLGVKLAKKANVPVIPVAVKTDFWRNGVHLRDFGPIDRSQSIHMAFGPPIACANQRQAHQAVLDFIAQKSAEWGVPVHYKKEVDEERG